MPQENDTFKATKETAISMLEWAEGVVTKGATPDEIKVLPDVINAAVSLLQYNASYGHF